MQPDLILEHFEENLLDFDSHFESHFESGLHQLTPFLQEMVLALRYPIEAGGKRIRPKLCVLLAQAIGSNAALDNALKAAKAIELVHTYSLVHDDLPCMDDDDNRRGRPTTHRVYGDAKALLVGDALLTEAFLWLSQLQTLHQPQIASLAVRIISTYAGYRGMIAGQWLDMSMDSTSNIHYDSVKTIHLLKTGCLIAASTELGTLCGLNERELSNQSSTQIRELARQAGKDLGIAFQLKDDILDATSTTEELGKTAGKDVKQGKQTAVSVLGLEQAKIETARISEDAKQKIALLFDRVPAKDEASEVARQAVFALVQDLTSRKN